MSPYAVMLAVFCLILGPPALLLAWTVRSAAREDAAVLRVLATFPAPMVGPQVARLSGVSTAYVTLARLEERGLVERHVDPPEIRVIYGQTFEVYGLSWYTITDAGRAEVSPRVETAPYRS